MPAICPKHGQTTADPEGCCTYCGRVCEFPAFSCESCGWYGDEPVLVDESDRHFEQQAVWYSCPSCGWEVKEG